MRVHEYLLQSECGYQGGQPYWDKVLDIDALNESVIFDPDNGFGGQGEYGCVNDGPFANLTLHLNATSMAANECLSRSFSQEGFQNGQQKYIDERFKTTNYVDAFECYIVNPHIAGHAAVGGIMADQVASPGDPLFFLHHTYHDRLWWLWQQANLTAS
ncbi:hypothetical protein QQX98_007200 [Neonectria punicea]|uniref:Tyrosinase copper-binding domain-containing protein n=1 Tax=Neonectria punicea TaxID=979145 RepID=A0ABR1GYV3_9HYPO